MFLGELNALAEEYGGTKVKFVFVYILEAHATDEWPIACINEIVPQHRTLKDHVSAAALFQPSYPLHANIELVLDNDQNDFNASFASWPFRYWILCKDRVVVKTMPVRDSVSLTALTDFLHTL